MRPNEYVTDDQTSRRLSAVGTRNTTPEKVVRSLLTSMGLRYRLHRHDLPGRPDIVFPGRRKVIFVHGCFWHRHRGCRRTTTPCRNAALWQEKFTRTIHRDAQNVRRLAALGWRVLVVWECETRQQTRLIRKLRAFTQGK
jgi:DNA mismatch endonuclease, patch repair protein